MKNRCVFIGSVWLTTILYVVLLLLLQFDYYKDLSEIAGIQNVKPVIAKIMKECGKKYIYELETYRQYNFKVLDDENFIKLSIK